VRYQLSHPSPLILGGALLSGLQAEVRVSEAAAEEAEQRAQQDRDQDQAEFHPRGFIPTDPFHPG
jgi:hypothetical protein